MRFYPDGSLLDSFGEALRSIEKRSSLFQPEECPKVEFGISFPNSGVREVMIYAISKLAPKISDEVWEILRGRIITRRKMDELLELVGDHLPGEHRTLLNYLCLEISAWSLRYPANRRRGHKSETDQFA